MVSEMWFPQTDTTMEAITTLPEALKNFRTSIRDARRRILTPPPRLHLSEWADKYRYLSPESSPEAGKWNTARAPYQREMLDVAGDYRTKKMVIMSAAQIGKTSLLENIIAYYISNDPAPILVVMPELMTAKAFSTDRLDTMIRDTPILHGLVKEKKAKDGGNTMLQKRFPGGHITLIGSNSAAGLRSRPIRVLLCDEVDAYPVSAGKEGDPVNLAIARTANYWNKKIILTSTPTVKDLSRIAREFEDSDQRYYHVPCPHCGTFQRLEWKNMKWETNNPQTAHMVCVGNGCVIKESDKLPMLKKGKWIASKPESDVVGFHLNALYSPWRTWRELVSTFLKVKDNTELLKTFVNTVWGELWDDQKERIEAHDLALRLEDYKRDSVPSGVGILTAGVDVQQDRIEVSVWGWGAGEESWLIDTDAIYKDPSQDAAWNDLSVTLNRKYKTASGALVGIRSIGIDSGYLSTKVYDYVKAQRNNHILALNPIGQASFLLSRPSYSNRGGVPLFSVGTIIAKDLIFGRMKIQTAGAGYIHLPSWVDVEVLHQLTAEKAVTKYRSGHPYREYIRLRRNEQLDMYVYAMAALHSLGRNLLPQLGELAKTLDAPTSASGSTDITPPPTPPTTPQPMLGRVLQHRLNGMAGISSGWNKGFKL